MPKISAYIKNIVKYVYHIGFICYICAALHLTQAIMFDFIFSLFAKLGALLFMISIVLMVVGFVCVMINGRGNGSSNNPGDSSMWG